MNVIPPTMILLRRNGFALIVSIEKLINKKIYCLICFGLENYIKLYIIVLNNLWRKN